MERGFEDLTLNEGEEEAFALPEELAEQLSANNLCLVGCFLTASVVHYPAMRNTLANLWHPLEGVKISDLGERRFLFQFFNEIDIMRVITGAPWTFNNHLLIFKRVQENEDPMSIPLLDVRKPLKRRKKVMLSETTVSYAKFRYEKLTLFCFLCGCLGHGENFCPIRLRIGLREGEQCGIGINLEGYKVMAESRVHQDGKQFCHVGTKMGDNRVGQMIVPVQVNKGISNVSVGKGKINEQELANMDCELENDPIIHDEGNKRQCSDFLTSNVSENLDLVEVGVGPFGYNYQGSAAALGQVDRAQ
ncbi:nucleolin-like [Gossypium australe]|uniref:Nucleolin-like n=1 Tax=Gossypium australe TaxID=47621 RepID=A0A5B6VDQ1_9ROSI|nr:nucleolin-like [Gossypium australe]